MAGQTHVVVHGNTTPTAQGGSDLPVAVNSSGEVVVEKNGTKVFQSDLTLDTGIYTAGDSLSDKLEITNAFPVANGKGMLKSITVIDKDDQGVGFDILIFGKDLTTTAKNSAWAVSDSDMEKCLGIVSIAAGDFVDLGNNRIATKSGLDIGVKNADTTTTTSLWVGTISRGGTPTYSANGIHLAVTIERD